MAPKLSIVELLLVDPTVLPKFLYSCAATDVIAKDIRIITEPTGLLWGGIGKYFPGGTAKRVGEKLTPNERKILALAGYNELLKAYNRLVDQPAEQARFLIALESARDEQVSKIRAVFSAVDGHNENADNALYLAAKHTNTVQSVACISLAVLATGGTVAAASGMTTLGALGLQTATAGKLFAITLGTKALVAGAQSDHDLKALGGFALGKLKDGAVTMGELSSKLFELGKDATINYSRGRMAQATADTITHMNEISEKIWQLQARFSYTAKSMLGEKPGTGIHNAMEAELRATKAEVDALKASLGTCGQSAVNASKTASFMKNFGGKAVPVVCLVIDVMGEGFRHQEVAAKIEKGGYRR